MIQRNMLALASSFFSGSIIKNLLSDNVGYSAVETGTEFLQDVKMRLYVCLVLSFLFDSESEVF